MIIFEVKIKSNGRFFTLSIYSKRNIRLHNKCKSILGTSQTHTHGLSEDDLTAKKCTNLTFAALTLLEIHVQIIVVLNVILRVDSSDQTEPENA